MSGAFCRLLAEISDCGRIDHESGWDEVDFKRGLAKNSPGRAAVPKFNLNGYTRRTLWHPHHTMKLIKSTACNIRVHILETIYFVKLEQ